ncbi:MAG: 50S ribosomal protein L29 [Planctomycetota bacterium]
MKAAELRERSVEELEVALVERKRELFQLKVRQSSHEEIESHQLKTLRRDIARIRTVLRQYGLVIEKTGLDEATVRSELVSANWEPSKAVDRSKVAQVMTTTGAEEALAQEALAARDGSAIEAIEAVRIAQAIAAKTDSTPKTAFTEFRRLRRDGFEASDVFRKVAESLTLEKTGASEKLARMALSDSNYSMKKAASLIEASNRVAEATGASAIAARSALEAAGEKEKLAVARLKARANKAKRAAAAAEQK